MDRAADQVQCLRCTSGHVARIYLRSARLDMCRCEECGFDWDQSNRLLPSTMHHA